jgi:hypothetical protein
VTTNDAALLNLNKTRTLAWMMAAAEAMQEVEAVGGVGRGEVHANIACDGCQMSPIVGARWKCRVCADLDLCDACHTAFAVAGNTVHTAGHVFCCQEAAVPMDAERLAQVLTDYHRMGECEKVIDLHDEIYTVAAQAQPQLASKHAHQHTNLPAQQGTT